MNETVLVFLGTRGEIEARSRRHRRHSALLVRSAHSRVMIDCGADWRNRFRRLSPTSIVLTHGHLDHAGGLADGAPCPVYATAETLGLLSKYPIEDSRIVPLRTPIIIGELTFEAFPVEHSLRAPAVGYRMVSAEGRGFFYVPDVVAIHDRHEALRDVDFYIGDGATVRRPIVRKRGRRLIGHAPISTQLGWCEKENVRRAIFTHCGSHIVKGDGRRVGAVVRRLGKEAGIDARIAYDGLWLLFG